MYVSIDMGWKWMGWKMMEGAARPMERSMEFHG